MALQRKNYSVLYSAVSVFKQMMQLNGCFSIFMTFVFIKLTDLNFDEFLITTYVKVLSVS